MRASENRLQALGGTTACPFHNLKRKLYSAAKSAPVIEKTTDEDAIHEVYVPRARIKSYQSSDSLDKWRDTNVVVDSETEEMELTGNYRALGDY